MKNVNKIINIKNSIFLLIGSLLIFSCQSTEEKSDGAYEEAKLSNEYSDDSLDMETEPELAPLLATKPMKVVVVDSWVKYSKEIEKEIKLNEKLISDLRLADGNNSKEVKKINSLEKSNLELNTKLVEYKQRLDADLEKFKSEMKLDLMELQEGIENFISNNN